MNDESIGKVSEMPRTDVATFQEPDRFVVEFFLERPGRTCNAFIRLI